MDDKLTEIIFAQIGTPQGMTIPAVRHFLKSFLSSRRVVDLPKWKWFPILHGIILPLRPKKLLPRYEQMALHWGGNPTLLTTESWKHFFNEKQTANLKFHFCQVLFEDSIAEVEKNLQSKSERIIIPLYPQYSEATSELIFDKIRTRFNAKTYPRLLALENFYDLSASRIVEYLRRSDASALLLSFHSYPLDRLQKGDSYAPECLECFEQLKNRIQSNNRVQVELSYQSKFGRGEWLEPLIEDKLLELKEMGHTRIAVHCPSFLFDSIETSWEIGIDLKEKMQGAGIEIQFIPSLGDDLTYCQFLLNEIKTVLNQ